ncbi:NUDIX hydrolase [Bifidobacterium miconis]|nr:NUDIX hydrolase [Bifidobacterium miconis]
MITPADLARMLDHASRRHTQNPLAPDELMYTSESSAQVSVHKAEQASGRGSESTATQIEQVERVEHVEIRTITPAEQQPAVAEPPHPRRPSPANMPPRRALDGPTTFASLDAQDLPVVREYSAGGLLFDRHGRLAFIARHSRSGHLEWCLPKGHIEKGETPQHTAVREVHEETGILGEVVDSIATIDYWFTGTSQRVHKLVHHFALRQVGGELSVDGDPDHEAEDAIWVDFEDLDGVLSYPNERKIAWLYAKKLNRQA